MTPRERVLKAMQLNHPDRVPLMCQFSFGFINQQLKGSGISPMEVWLDANKYAEALLLLRKRYNFDGILVSVHGHFKDWKSKISHFESKNGIEVATFENRIETYPDDDLPSASFKDQHKPIITDFNIDSVQEKINYIPSSGNCHAFIDQNNPFEIFDIVDEKVNNEYSIHGEITSPFDYFLDLFGYENALSSLLIDPDLCKTILQKYTDGLIRIIDEMCNKNIDAIKISSPFAGMGFISPQQYLEFEQPFIKQLTETISDQGKFSYIHTCGYIGDRLEYMTQTGTNGLECLDPPPLGNVDLKDAFERVGSDIFIKGNIDPINTLFKGNLETITQDVIERLKIGKQNPGFILSSACSIAPKTKTENIQILSKLIEKCGYY